MQNIFVVLNSCQDTLILNSFLNDSVLKAQIDTTIECWAPDGGMFLCNVKDIAGNIVEVSSIIHNGRLVQNVPKASLVVISDGEGGWFIRRYYCGVYNKTITELMQKFGVTDYQLP